MKRMPNCFVGFTVRLFCFLEVVVLLTLFPLTLNAEDKPPVRAPLISGTVQKPESQTSPFISEPVQDIELEREREDTSTVEQKITPDQAENNLVKPVALSPMNAPMIPARQLPPTFPEALKNAAPSSVPIPGQGAPVSIPQPGGIDRSQPKLAFQQPRQEGTAVLNFSDANLKDILRTVAEITGENFIISPGINAKISVQTTKPVPKTAVFGIFESILEANGLAVIKSGNYFKIVAAQSIIQKPLELLTGKNPENLPPGDRVMNLVVPVEFISANDLLQIIKPMLSHSGSVIIYSKANTLIITDTVSNIRKALEIINLLDVDAFKRMNIAFVPIVNVDIKTLTKELADVFGALGFGKDTAQLSVVPIERLNSLIVFSSTEELLFSAKEWIERLDRTLTAEGASIHIYYVLNDKASNIKNILDQIFSGKKEAQPFVAPALTQQPGVPLKVPVFPSQSDANYGQTVLNMSYDGEVRIYLYEPMNALIIQSSQRDYRNILNTVRELDRPPKQVLIEALIAEVKLDESTKYGIQWSALSGNFNVQQNTGIFTSSINNPRANISTPIGLTAPTGLTAFATDASRFFAVIQALASDGKINVLSNPHIVVKNYEKASINVGSDEPVATQSTQTAVTGTAGIIQNIEYRKTGILLTVTPQITEGGMVAMTIRQEVSDKSTDRVVGGAVYPSFTKREAETSVVAKDMETLVIGGLIQDKKDSSTTGIPLLSNIPLLGNLFKFTSKNNGKTELIILLTPKVISNSEQAVVVTEEIKNKLMGLKELLLPKDTGE